ncbi:TPA: helix-turn-helix domain-containing protein [Escherichia coli]|nr:helix-turn-helix domain-containing protein [Escherichia coli]
MSTKLTGYVWDGCAASGMKLSSVAIMARLADFSNDEGVCWPSIETIARQIGAGMSTVRTASDALIIEGCLARLKQKKPDEHSLLVAHYLYRISKRKIAKVRGKDEKLVRIEIQLAEGFIDGCLSMLDVNLEMDA